jgi:multimeric flavodoxin WrbA
MKIVAINGSPRRNKNTAKLLDNFIEGVKTVSGFEAERIDLFDYNNRGCTSCFACKRKVSETYGHCSINDDLAPVLNNILKADGIVFGSPVYFGSMTGQTICFLERLMYPLYSYEKGNPIMTPKRMPTAFIYSMNVTAEECEALNYNESLGHYEKLVEQFFTAPVSMKAYNTYQFDNYLLYRANGFDESEKAKYRDMHFQKDCNNAQCMGVEMAEKAMRMFG